MRSLLIASDHAGFNLKSKIVSYLKTNNIRYTDLGCDSLSTSVDYPDYANKLCQDFDENNNFGILICGSGVGVSIAANRYSNIRAALCRDEEIAKLARQHNDANVICLGARFIEDEKAISVIKTFLETHFENGRHQIRVEKLSGK
ncbi:MAG: ribose 5-phosphate isomerase B [Rickettsiales bacterium]|nr:ribose 5-phosphate isomerase B [Rickettsiales bacterium]